MQQPQQNIPQVPIDTAEMEILQKYFKDNDELLISMRAVMLDLYPTDTDKKAVSEVFANDDVMSAVTYRFLPEPKRDTPIGQIQDIWLGVEQMVFGSQRDTIEQAVLYKEQALKMTRAALDLLRDPTGPKTSLMYSSTSLQQDPLQVGLLARNQFIRHIEQQLLFLKLVSAQLVETPVQIAKKKKKNSSSRG